MKAHHPLAHCTIVTSKVAKEQVREKRASDSLRSVLQRLTVDQIRTHEITVVSSG